MNYQIYSFIQSHMVIFFANYVNPTIKTQKVFYIKNQTDQCKFWWAHLSGIYYLYQSQSGFAWYVRMPMPLGRIHHIYSWVKYAWALYVYNHPFVTWIIFIKLQVSKPSCGLRMCEICESHVPLNAYHSKDRSLPYKKFHSATQNLGTMNWRKLDCLALFLLCHAKLNTEPPSCCYVWWRQTVSWTTIVGMSKIVGTHHEDNPP